MERLAITNISHHHKNNLIAIIAASAIIASYRANRDDKGAGEMETIKQMRERITRERKTLDHLAALQARGNVATVVAGNACPRRMTCMVELSALQLYDGRGRTMVVPHGCNPFKTPN